MKRQEIFGWVWLDWTYLIEIMIYSNEKNKPMPKDKQILLTEVRNFYDFPESRKQTHCNGIPD